MNLKPVTSATHQGTRYYQEDRFFTLTCEKGTLIAVCDGHGGAQCSHRVSESLPVAFAEAISKPKTTVRKALEESIHQIAVEVEYFQNGSTLSCVFVPFKGNYVTCAVVGDSPIVIKDADGNINISPDHNVRTNPEEAQAVIERGGFVQNGYAFATYDGGGLQMGRALGDTELRRILSTKPDIYRVKVNKESFVIVATDGAFDPGHYDFKQSAAAVVQIVAEGGEAEQIVKHALDIKTGDNVTALVGRFE